MTPSPLRPIAVVRPMSPTRPLPPALGPSAPPAVRHTADFIAGIGTGPRIGSWIAQRSLGFGNRLAALGGQRRVALPELLLELRHRRRVTRRGAGVEHRVARWPVWSTPPAIGIPARHEHFLGLPVLPEAAVATEIWEARPAIASPEFAMGGELPVSPRSLLRALTSQSTVPPTGNDEFPAGTMSDDVPVESLFAPAESGFAPAVHAPAAARPIGHRAHRSHTTGTTAGRAGLPAVAAFRFATGILGPAAPELILYRPPVRRASDSAAGLTAMRSISAAREIPGALIGVGDLAARVAAHHAVPEMFSPSDVSRWLAAEARSGERPPAQWSWPWGPPPAMETGPRSRPDGLFPHQTEGGRAAIGQGMRPRSGSSPLVPSDVGAAPETTTGHGYRYPEPLMRALFASGDGLSPHGERRRTESVRSNFTLDLFRHARWQPERTEIGAGFVRRVAADQTARLYGGPDAAGAGALPPSAAPVSPLAPPMRIAPVTTTLVAPLPPSTLPAPAADWPGASATGRAPATGWTALPSRELERASSASPAGAPPAEPSLVPAFVAARIARAAWVTPASIGAGPDSPPWEATPGERPLAVPFHPAAGRATAPFAPDRGTVAGSFRPAAWQTAAQSVSDYVLRAPFRSPAASVAPGPFRPVAPAALGPLRPTAPWVSPLEHAGQRSGAHPTSWRQDETLSEAPGRTSTASAQGFAPEILIGAGGNLPSSPPTAAVELPMVMRRLGFGSDRARQALAATVSPVWGALGTQVVPTIPASRPGAPVTPSLPLAWPGGATRRADRAPAATTTTASWPASPFIGELPGFRAAAIGREAGPVVFRSSLAERPEPTVAEQAEAAEAMAMSTGQPLPPLVRRSMEHRFGMDLAAVRVHSGPAATRAANLVAARAMARGTDVFMPGGVPETPAAAGMPLLAHELTHVAHHLGRRVPAEAPPLTLARRTSDQEREADRIERQFLDRFPSLPGLGSLPTGGLPQMPNLPNAPDSGSLTNSALTLARPVVGALQKPVQQAAESALGKAENAIGSILGTGAPAAAAAPNPAQLAEQVYTLLERRLLLERERGGYRR